MTEVRSTCDVDQGVADWLQNKMYDEVRDLIARAASEISHVEEIADEIAGIMRKAVLPDCEAVDLYP